MPYGLYRRTWWSFFVGVAVSAPVAAQVLTPSRVVLPEFSVRSVSPGIERMALPQGLLPALPELDLDLSLELGTDLDVAPKFSDGAALHALGSSLTRSRREPGLGQAPVLDRFFDQAQLRNSIVLPGLAAPVLPSLDAPRGPRQDLPISRLIPPQFDPRGPPSSGRVSLREVAARAGILAWRVATFPAHFWPFNLLQGVLAHGEPLTGLSARSAVNTAIKNAERGRATVIGRLAPSLRDRWSARGAEQSFLNAIAYIKEAKKTRPNLEASLALDHSYFGADLVGRRPGEAFRIAMDSMLRIGRAAKDAGVGIELDVGYVEELPDIYRSAEILVRRLKVPVRLAIAARHRASPQILANWIALARETNVRLGVRLVKGSYIQADPRLINTRRELLQRHRDLITQALKSSDAIDVGVATQNRETYRHARDRAKALGARFSVHVIRGVAPEVQAEMDADGNISREYVSYGPDAPAFGLMEIYHNWRARRELVRQGFRRELLD